jgi:hypothetical protein
VEGHFVFQVAIELTLAEQGFHTEPELGECLAHHQPRG